MYGLNRHPTSKTDSVTLNADPTVVQEETEPLSATQTHVEAGFNHKKSNKQCHIFFQHFFALHQAQKIMGVKKLVSFGWAAGGVVEISCGTIIIVSGSENHEK